MILTVISDAVRIGCNRVRIDFGGVPQRPNGRVWRTRNPQGFVGSNPTLSANLERRFGMIGEYLSWPISIIIFSIFGVCCLINLIFTFSLEKYEAIEAKLDSILISSPAVNPLDSKINLIDCWAKQHNKKIGFILSAISIFNLLSFTRILMV